MTRKPTLLASLMATLLVAAVGCSAPTESDDAEASAGAATGQAATLSTSKITSRNILAADSTRSGVSVRIGAPARVAALLAALDLGKVKNLPALDRPVARPEQRIRLIDFRSREVAVVEIGSGAASLTLAEDYADIVAGGARHFAVTVDAARVVSLHDQAPTAGDLLWGVVRTDLHEIAQDGTQRLVASVRNPRQTSGALKAIGLDGSLDRESPACEGGPRYRATFYREAPPEIGVHMVGARLSFGCGGELGTAEVAELESGDEGAGVAKGFATVHAAHVREALTNPSFAF